MFRFYLITHASDAMRFDRINDDQNDVERQQMSGIDALNGIGILRQLLDRILENIRSIAIAIVIQIQFRRQSFPLKTNIAIQTF